MKISLISTAMLSLLILSSCAMPSVVSNPNSGYPQSVTETHTKTTIVAPPSYSTPYMPPAAIYQVSPQQQTENLQSQFQATKSTQTDTKDKSSLQYDFIDSSNDEYIVISKDENGKTVLQVVKKQDVKK